MKNVVSYFVSAMVCLMANPFLLAQPAPGVYTGMDPDDPQLVHEVKLNGNYLIYTEYSKAPEFIRTRGGFFEAHDDTLKVELEFNSSFEQDSIRKITIPYEVSGDQLNLTDGRPVSLKRADHLEQELDGAWLFATRGPDTGQERRGESNPRKTLKFLTDGHFQWIAYQTETMNFSGTGGGSYTAKNGMYTENIEFFSRDNSRVGAVLEFNYERKGDDWHHTGKNSRGEPMYEIWSLRK